MNLIKQALGIDSMSFEIFIGEKHNNFKLCGKEVLHEER